MESTEDILKMKTHFDGYWNWFFGDKEPDYQITGKYLFFCDDKNKLIKIAKNEIENHDFYEAKINEKLLEDQTDYVLCLYYKDDSRKYELAERNKSKYNVKYRYWKSDEATLKGEYSQEFLSKLKKPDKTKFASKKNPQRD